LALGTSVTVEAIAVRFMAASSVRDLLEGKGDLEARGRSVTYRDIAKFYFPLALTSFISLSIQPLLTFFMGHSIAPLESLAVFPVVHALSFFFRSMGLALQDTAIALMGERFTHLPELKKFSLGLGLATTSGLALVAFTPLSRLWFETVSGLTPELASFALVPTRILVPLPLLAVLLSLQRAILVEGRKTHYITVASALEVGCVAILFITLGFRLDLVGATAAFAAFLGGRLVSVSYLLVRCRDVLRAARAPTLGGA
jgi:O-antigen/teichoic acid export membrane protein